MQQTPLQAPLAPVDTQQQAATPSQALLVAPSSTMMIKAPERSELGTIGRKCVIRANHFHVDVGKKNPYQYDVTITPEVISNSKSREILKMLGYLYTESHFGNMLLAYDGKRTAFSAGPLPFESKDFLVKVTETNGTEKDFKVNIKFASTKDLNYMTQKTIQALDVVLREAALKPGRQIIGRSLFGREFGNGVLGDGVEFWKGFYQNLDLAQMGLSLNIDMSAKPFHEPKLVTDFIGEFLGKDVLTSPLTDRERIKVQRALRGLQVEVRHDDYMRSKKVKALSVQPTSQLTFLVGETGVIMSMVEYFREKYNIQIQCPHLPAIQVGADIRPTYLPLEMCRIAAGQRYTLKLSEKQVTKFLKATCERPQDREKRIIKTMKSNNYSTHDLVNKEFGMRVDQQMATIDARVLPPPPLKYHESGANSVVNPSKGEWNMINQKMINAGSVNYWAVANFSCRSEDDVKQFLHGLVSMCQNKGMVFNPQPLIPIYNAEPDNVEKALVDIQSQCQAQLEKVAPGSSLELLLVILPEAIKAYARIKRVCEIELGIVSQCCMPQYVTEYDIEYFEHVSLKINVKVGGRNVVLAAALANRLPYITDIPTIIFGADVIHPSTRVESRPSIAAVVASMDWPQVTKYKALVSTQPHRQVIIEDLYLTTTDERRGVVHSGLIRELLISFLKSTGHKPHRIIFYRDGVNEGQHNEVLVNEMDKIRKACESLEEGYMPPVTFIVVARNHHIRFFPVNHGDIDTTDRSGNILPGTVVDTNICHPMRFDFYLCSHAGIQGTSKPTHYYVLYDENNFTADDVQDLTNNLCYTSQRCMNSVSVVSPAYHAHLAALRAHDYIKGGLSKRDGVSEVHRVPVIHKNVKDLMFFC